jgi:hypothetical protein
MTHERQHTHAQTTQQQSTHDEDLARGRESSTLDAPAHPIASGLIQRKTRDENGVAADADSAIATAASSSGSSLPEPVMRKFESSLGTDLSSVRVHTGGESATAAHAVGARAYTTGQDIHFGAGEYDPSSTGGQHLLAHEVAHTVQQRGGSPTRQNKLEVSSPGDSYEHEADSAADAMVSGAKASISAAGGLSSQVVSRGIATAYSDDDDLKRLPKAPSFSAADGSFGAMAASIAASMKGDGTTIAAPASGFVGSINNLLACRDNAESENVYYSTNLPSKWNPFASGRANAMLAQNAQADASWAITMLANVRVAGSATGSWVPLVNGSNKAWGDLVTQAKAMSIEVKNKVEKAPLAGMADGKDHHKAGDQEINKLEVGSAGMGLGVDAKKLGLKAPDTSAYKKAMQGYSEARNELAPQQQKIITTLIPTNITSIKGKLKQATDEKEKWETVAQATDVFEKGLTVAFGGASFAEGEIGQLGTTEEGGLASPKAFDAKDAVEKGHGILAKGIELRIAAIQKQIDVYNGNLKTYTDVQEAMTLKANVGEYKNGLVKLKNKAQNVQDERTKMEAALKEFGKSLDDAMIKKGQAPKGSDNNQQAAKLMIAIRTAATTTQGAVDALTSGGVADLPGLYSELAKHASDRKQDQTGGDGRRDARAAVFAIEAGRWGAANSAVASVGSELARRQVQITGLETEFLAQFANSSQGTDSLK